MFYPVPPKRGKDGKIIPVPLCLFHLHMAALIKQRDEAMLAIDKLQFDVTEIGYRMIMADLDIGLFEQEHSSRPILKELNAAYDKLVSVFTITESLELFRLRLGVLKTGVQAYQPNLYGLSL